MHITKLAAVAFIENDNNLLVVNRMLLILFDKSRELLNCGDDNVRLSVAQLFC